jgi:hypothetical protein
MINWRKTSRSGATNQDCVEVAQINIVFDVSGNRSC